MPLDAQLESGRCSQIFREEISRFSIEGSI